MNKKYFFNIVYILCMLSNTIQLKGCQSLISYSILSGFGGYFFGTSLQNALRYRQYRQVTECRLRCLQTPENTKQDLEQYLEIENTFRDKDALNRAQRSHYYRFILKDMQNKEFTLKNLNGSVLGANEKIEKLMNDN